MYPIPPTPAGTPHPASIQLPAVELSLSTPPPAPPSTPFDSTAAPTLLPSPPLLIPPISRPRLKRSHTTSAGLEAIREAVSPDERVQSEDSWVQGLKEGLEGAARVKRRKKEPDHEAFAQLSLANGLSPPAPVPPPLASGTPSQYQHTLIPPAPLPFPQPQAHPYPNRDHSAPNPFGAPVTPPLQQGESHLTSSTVTPTSHSDIEPSLSPPFSMGGEESFGLGLGLGLSAPGGLENMSRSSAPSMEDAEMRPNRGTYDIDPHRVYIASLSDDETSPPPSPPSSSLALHPSLLANGSFPPSPLPPSLVPSPSAGPLILYRPLKFGPEAEREKQEQEEEEKRASRKAELDEFRRQQEMEERMESAEEEVLDAQEGVEMMDLDG